MTWVRQFLFAAGALWRRRIKDRELEEELRFHVDEEIEERRSGGVPKEEAMWAARKELATFPLKIRKVPRTAQDFVGVVWTGDFPVNVEVERGGGSEI